jgi:hypothetical protein
LVTIRTITIERLARLSQESDSFSAISSYEIVFSPFCGLARRGPLRGPRSAALITRGPSNPNAVWGKGKVQKKQSKRPPRRPLPKVSCDECYFRRNLLCALDLLEPCGTFRPNDAQLKPPQQMRFVFRQERRSRSAWAFPSASEQAALHA